MKQVHMNVLNNMRVHVPEINVKYIVQHSKDDVK